MATPDYKTFATRDNGQQTTDNGQAVAGGDSQELRNYGTTDGASRLGTQSSVTLYTLLYSLYSQLTANCSHALALRCLLSVDCCP